MSFSKLEHHQNRYAAALDEIVAADAIWLDVGAGTQIHDGWLGRPQVEVAARARQLIGCDVFVEHLHRNTLLSQRVGASVYRLPFQSGSFDVISANMVLEHLEHPEAALAEIGRVLKPGGAFVFVTPSVNNPVIRVASLILNSNARRQVASMVERRDLQHIFPTFYRANEAALLRSLAEPGGMRVERLDTFFTWPFLHRFPVLRHVERAYIEALRTIAGNRLGTNLLGIFRKIA